MKIIKFLAELQRHFPRLEDWIKIYPTPWIKLSAVEVYKGVIEFSRHTVEYFGRFWRKPSLPPRDLHHLFLIP